MAVQNKRVVTYLSEKYKDKLRILCKDREEKEATIVREILRDFFDHRERQKWKDKLEFRNSVA